MFILLKCTFIFLCGAAKKRRQEYLRRNYFTLRHFAAFGNLHLDWDKILSLHLVIKHYQNFLETRRVATSTAAAEDFNQKEGTYTSWCLAPFYLGNLCWPDNKVFFSEISDRRYRCRLQRNTLNYTILHWSTHQLSSWLSATVPGVGGGVIFHVYIQYITLHMQDVSYHLHEYFYKRNKGHRRI